MELTDRKIHVGIVAKQFLFRLGIKTVLSVIGIEPEISEFNEAVRLKTYLLKNADLDFAIISEDVINDNTDSNLNEIKKYCPKVKLLLIGEESIKSCSYCKYVFNTDNQKEVLDKLQDFFFEPEEPEHNEEHKPILSEREIDVLKNVALGYSNKQIADNLFISVNTVITHRKNITEKLGIKTIAGLTVYAIMNDLINPDEVKF